MLGLSDASLKVTLEPVVTVMRAFKKASSWRTLKEAWAAAKLSDRWWFSILFFAFSVLGVLCVVFNNGWLFFLAVCFGIAGPFVLRYRIINCHASRNKFELLDSYFSLNHRLRRYLIFRHDLQTAAIGSKEITKIRKLLIVESALRDSQRFKVDAPTTVLISTIVSLLTTLSTQEYLLSSGHTVLILFLCLVCLYAYGLWKTIFPGYIHSRSELECFLSWYEEELSHHAI